MPAAVAAQCMQKAAVACMPSPTGNLAHRDAFLQLAAVQQASWGLYPVRRIILLTTKPMVATLLARDQS